MQDALPAIYPDYVGVTIPAEIAPLNFNSVEADIDCMDVVVRGSKGGELHVQGDEADFNRAFRSSAESAQGNDHNKNQEQRDNLFHV
jgi:hypothetical protein